MLPCVGLSMRPGSSTSFSAAMASGWSQVAASWNSYWWDKCAVSNTKSKSWRHIPHQCKIQRLHCTFPEGREFCSGLLVETSTSIATLLRRSYWERIWNRVSIVNQNISKEKVVPNPVTAVKKLKSRDGKVTCLNFVNFSSLKSSTLLFCESQAWICFNVMKNRDNKVYIGIDLGTANARISIWREGKCTIIPNEHGHISAPCLVAFTDSELLIELKSGIASELWIPRM
jgi:hypothetical protein